MMCNLRKEDRNKLILLKFKQRPTTATVHIHTQAHTHTQWTALLAAEADRGANDGEQAF